MHFLEHTVNHRGKCVQPVLAAIFVGSLSKHTHVARETENRVGVETFLYSAAVHFFRVRAPTTPSTTKTTTTTKTTELTDERSFGESRRDTSRAKILLGIHLGPSSRVVSEGSPPVVTACHVGSLKGQRHPEELLASSSVIRRAELWRRSPPVVVFAIRL